MIAGDLGVGPNRAHAIRRHSRNRIGQIMRHQLDPLKRTHIRAFRQFERS